MRSPIFWVFSTMLFIGLGYVLAQPKAPTSPPEIQIPTKMDRLFEHIILTAQNKSDFNTRTIHKECTELEQCQPYEAVFAKYLNFKEALLTHQSALAHLPLNELLHEIMALQSQYFTEQEIALLFDDDNQWQAYTLAKLEVNLDNSLTDELKHQLLANIDASQPEHILSALKPSKDIHALNTELNEAFNSQNYNQLASEFGDAAATRLIDLQHERQQWQALCKQLINEISHLKQNLSSSQAQQKTAQLLDKHLTTQQKRHFLALYSET